LTAGCASYKIRNIVERTGLSLKDKNKRTFPAEGDRKESGVTAEQKIKELAIQRGADLAGIASVDDINKYAPPGHRPDDVLIGAKSVIVIAGIHTPRGAWRSPDYRTHYKNRDFPRIRMAVAMAITSFIESEYGYYALAELPPWDGHNPPLSLKLCAELAGLGTRSLAGALILHPELGMLNYHQVITTMPLAADGPISEPVCPHPSCVKLWERQGTTPCLEVCPECLSGEIEGGRIKWMRYDRRICSTRAQTEGMGGLLKTLLEGIDDPDPAVRRNVVLGSLTRAAITAVSLGAVVGQCGECIRNCPVCRGARSLKVKSPGPGMVG
jgi:epoxyqueuosine reductase QueG